jgi:hypothetical protein
MLETSTRAAQRGALTAVGTFVAGFGVLFAFSKVATSDPSLPGLFDYLSATWGDGLLLPTSAGALVFALNKLPARRHNSLAPLVAGIIGGVIGAGTQVQWLLDDSPNLNWTLPRPHHFNAAGTYHAIFLTLASAGFAALWAEVLRRLSTGAMRDANRILIWISLAVALVAQLAFGWLVLIDNRSASSTQAGHATEVALLLAAAIALMSILGAVIARRFGSTRR